MEPRGREPGDGPRAFRIGQHRNVLVHKFVTSGTIEEKIQAPVEGLQVVATASPCVRYVIARDDRRVQAVDRMRARAWPVPEGYEFDRDEANAR